MATGRVPTTANSPLTAKGDLFTYSTAPARLAVGNNGDSLVADSSAATGLRYQADYAAGKNKIINANMVIDQRNAGSSVTLTASAPYLVDRWIGLEDTDGVMTAQQDSTAPSGFAKSLKFTTTTADASLSAAQQTRTQQFIEGNNIADFAFGTAAAKTVTLSFWVRSSLTGTFAGSLREYNATRSYVFNYSISAANTFEYKTITIPGDTSGTWATSNLGGAAVIFDLGSGSNYQATANTWSAGSFFSTSGATSVIGTLNATWYVTGVQLEIGSVATAFQTMTGNIQGELAACQRYFIAYAETSNHFIGMASIYSATQAIVGVSLPVSMRTNPSLAQNTAGNYYTITRTASGTGAGFSTAIIDTNNLQNVQFYVVGSGMVEGYGGYCYLNNSSGYLWFSAEL